MELFWDVVDALDRRLDDKVAVLDAAIRRYNDRLAPHGGEKIEKAENNEAGGEREQMEVDGESAKTAAFVVGVDTTEKELRDIMKQDNDQAAQMLTDEDLSEIYIFVSISSVLRHGSQFINEFPFFSCTVRPLESKRLKREGPKGSSDICKMIYDML